MWFFDFWWIEAPARRPGPSLNRRRSRSRRPYEPSDRTNSSQISGHSAARISVDQHRFETPRSYSAASSNFTRRDSSAAGVHPSSAPSRIPWVTIASPYPSVAALRSGHRVSAPLTKHRPTRRVILCVLWDEPNCPFLKRWGAATFQGSFNWIISAAIHSRLQSTKRTRSEPKGLPAASLIASQNGVHQS